MGPHFAQQKTKILKPCSGCGTAGGRGAWATRSKRGCRRQKRRRQTGACGTGRGHRSGCESCGGGNSQRAPQLTPAQQAYSVFLCPSMPLWMPAFRGESFPQTTIPGPTGSGERTPSATPQPACQLGHRGNGRVSHLHATLRPSRIGRQRRDEQLPSAAVRAERRSRRCSGATAGQGEQRFCSRSRSRANTT